MDNQIIGTAVPLKQQIIIVINSTKSPTPTFKPRTNKDSVPSCLTKQFLKKVATLWPTLKPEHRLTRTALMIASNLSAGEPNMNLQGDRHWSAFEESMFLGASIVVATPIIKIIGILTTHSLITEQ